MKRSGLIIPFASFFSCMRPLLLGLLMLGLLTGCSDSDDDSGDEASDAAGDVVAPAGDVITALSINPEVTVIDSAESSTFVLSVDGGNGDYSWSVSDSRLGSIENQGESVVYTSAALESGVNVVLVSDSDNNSGTTTITQE